MTARHTISQADELYAGKAWLDGAVTDNRRGVRLSNMVAVNLGSPNTSDTDGVVNGATVATDAATSLTLALTTLDVPRNLIVDSSDDTEVDGVVTITGADVWGQTMVEKITANGTTAVAGKKAFKTLTTISVAACTSAGTIDVGFGDVLGLPYRVDNKREVFSPQADGSVEDWTVVVADTDQDDTSGDPRGTVVPATTTDGSVNFSCIINVADVSTKDAAYGVDHYTG